ncbi:GbsR/MarR family transcriptional regulator [Sulfuriroseicoccus oceanibius]|uniref:HTH-type transcriptional regulator n=1 Tax=Sulfuriroseicoccus oceanibius TaxID=2707525 RepID=A0A6B3L4G5_9BACT|nr:hypothetical protein [Sulfuriroseicoccus oceanibius]QQL45609.1 hypothetical protein G3M56_003195 [Sulfuriroseicoccus oceanibius]
MESAEKLDQVEVGEASLDEVRGEVVEVFSDIARLLGLPKSVGGIYGYLFTSRAPRSLDDVVTELKVSKGSGSQGLAVLRQLGAVRSVTLEGSRRDYFIAETELKSLVAGFIRSELAPQVEQGLEKSVMLQDNVRRMREFTAGRGEDFEEAQFMQERLDKLGQWHRRAKWVLPFIARFLG